LVYFDTVVTLTVLLIDTTRNNITSFWYSLQIHGMSLPPINQYAAFCVSCLQASLCYCSLCKRRGPRLHACLQCIFFGCYSGHIQEHYKVKNHFLGKNNITFHTFVKLLSLLFFLAVDVNHGSVMCFICQDYVYDADLEAIAVEHRVQACRSLGIRPMAFRTWEPTPYERELLALHPRRKRITNQSTIGESMCVWKCQYNWDHVWIYGSMICILTTIY
jgi:hypothetical protein